MADYFPLIAAVLAFIGTVLGVYFAHMRWLREKSLERYSLYEAERQSAYRELWQRVESLNIMIRVQEVTEQDFLSHLQDLNSFILANGIYLEDQDRVLANEYTRAVFSFSSAVNEAEKEGFELPLGTTQEMPKEVVSNIKEVADAQQKALTLRAKLLNRIKGIVGGIQDNTN